jgi:hypothetical protein
LAVPVILKTIENSDFATWIRESPNFFAFYGILTFHAVGLVMIAGPALVIALRLLGVAKDMPLAPLRKLFPVIWCGLGINLVSGLLLLYSYPTKGLTNWQFYAKMLCVVLGAIVTRKIQKRMEADPNESEATIMEQTRGMAFAVIVLWLSVISIGKFLPYTYIYLFYGIHGNG